MNDQIQPENRAATPPEPGLSETAAGGVGVYETRSDETSGATGSNAVNTYDRPAAAARSGPNVLAILLLLVILALLAYAAFQLIR